MRYLFLFSLFAWAALCTKPAQAQKPLRIAFLSDTHTNSNTTGDQPLYKAHLEEVIQQVNATGVDVVLIAGDLTQGGKAEEMEDFKKQIAAFKAPVLYVPGNHDIGNKHYTGGTNPVNTVPIAHYEATLGRSFDSWVISGVRILGVNSPILGSGLPHEADQWKFLEKELAVPSSKPTIVFMHYPPYVTSTDEPGGNYHNVEPEPRARLLKLLKQGGVRTLLTAHLHRPLTNRYEGLFIYTTPPVSFGLPAGKQPEGWTLVTLPPAGEPQIEFRAVKH